MLSILKHILLFTTIIAFLPVCYAQAEQANDSTYIIIDTIQLSGNKKTKAVIIIRELDFKIGDTVFIKTLEDRINHTKNRLFNTGLFLETDIEIIGTDAIHKIMVVELEERFFTIIIPIVGLADRNFNEWWVQRNHDLNRLDIGIYLLQKNMRGRNETMKIKFEFAFTKKIEFTYTIPYLTKSRKLGLIFNIGYILNRQIAYNTLENKLFFVEGNKFLRERFGTGLTFTYRGSFYIEHQLGATYYNNSVGDTITALNPKYFLNGNTNEEFVSLKYSFIRDHKDIRYYPLKGSYLRFDVEQMGVSPNRAFSFTSFKGEVSLFKQLKKRFYLATTFKGKYSTPIQQPWFNQRGLGYDKEIVSGYEQYVVDGQKYLLTKWNFKYQLFNKKIQVLHTGDERFTKIPLQVYLKMYMDLGYVWDLSYAPGNNIYANSYLPGGGFGIDFVSYYDFVLRVEYSINKNWHRGIFINFKAAI